MTQEITYHTIIAIRNLSDKEEILNALSCTSTDEDFNGNNGEEFTRKEALEEGFESSQDYVLSKLRKSNLIGEDLIIAFFKEWLDNDNYYSEWDFTASALKGGMYVCSIVALQNN